MPSKKQLKIDNALLASELERIRVKEKAISDWVKSLRKGKPTPNYELTYLDDIPEDMAEDIEKMVGEK